MKELSIEQKAQRYDEILARAKGADIPYYKDDIMSKVKEFVYYLIPELAESEDERIRKALISFFTERAKYTEDSTFGGLSSKDIIAWLEKQAKQKPLNKIKIGKEYKCIASPRYSAFIRGNIYKPEDEFICSLMNFCSDCFEPIEDEQKPADKEVEPKFKIGDRVRNIKNGKESVISEMLEYVYDGIIPFYIKDQDEWELVEPRFKVGQTIKKKGL